MSRSGYSDDCDGWELIRWRGAVSSAIKGKRGQAFLRELLAALDAMPQKSLIVNGFEAGGEFCVLGVLGHARNLDMAKIDPEDRTTIARTFGIAEAMAAEILFENDDWDNEPSEHRWSRMRMWVVAQIKGPEREAAA